MSGTLSGPGGPIVGASVALSRADGAGTAVLPAAVTDVDGSWHATVPFGLGDATYTAAYAGDTDHTAVQKTLDVALDILETAAQARRKDGSRPLAVLVRGAGRVAAELPLVSA